MTRGQAAALKEMETLRKHFHQACVHAAAKPLHYRTQKDWPLRKKNGDLNVRELRLWMREMVAWGRLVRQDIRRLEECCCLPPGDPGDPPPEPQ